MFSRRHLCSEHGVAIWAEERNFRNLQALSRPFDHTSPSEVLKVQSALDQNRLEPISESISQ